MDINKLIPIVVFDDQCYLCSKFAKIVDFLSRGSFTIIGHYSNSGKEIGEQILDESALEMFWFINKRAAYGGRAALFPLIYGIFATKRKKIIQSIQNGDCIQGCKNAKSVFLRSASLLSKSKKIKLK